MIRIFLSSLLLCAAAGAANPACQAAADAMENVYKFPVHIYTVETAAWHPSGPRSSELIYLNDATYIFVNGRWRTMPMSQADMEETRRKAGVALDPHASCDALGMETVNGEPAAVYRIQVQDKDERIDEKVWISPVRHLALKAEADMDVGGAAGKSHRSTRYEYTNVHAPAGLR